MTDTLTKTTDTKTLREVASGLLFEGEPSLVFEDAARIYNEGKLHEMQNPDLKKLAFAPGLGSQVSISSAVDAIHVPLAVSFARQLIEEYKCVGASEIAMAEVAAVSYVQFVVASKWSATHVNDFAFDKKADRAFRRFVSAISLLRHMKAPPMTVKVVTDTAFIAQNQVNQENKAYAK